MRTSQNQQWTGNFLHHSVHETLDYLHTYVQRKRSKIVLNPILRFLLFEYFVFQKIHCDMGGCSSSAATATTTAPVPIVPFEGFNAWLKGIDPAHLSSGDSSAQDLAGAIGSCSTLFAAVRSRHLENIQFYIPEDAVQRFRTRCVRSVRPLEFGACACVSHGHHCKLAVGAAILADSKRSTDCMQQLEMAQLGSCGETPRKCVAKSKQRSGS